MRDTTGRRFLWPRAVLWAAIAASAWPASGAPGEGEPAASPSPANRVAVPGTLELHTRLRRETAPGSGQFEVVEEVLHWEAAQTAIIVCDMWDDNFSQSAARRVDLMAPRMNEVLWAARDLGVQIIHAPSNTMNYYKDTPYRRRMQRAQPAEPPMPILDRCPRDPASEPPLPIDDSDGGNDDPVPQPSHQAYQCQHPAIDITGYDGITDRGAEVYNFCRQEGITNVVLMGVHANICVLGRSFGIRQMTRLGMNVVLARDLTDALYDPRDPPHVSHTRGTELVVEHIERHWCPSIQSDDLTRVLPGTAGP